MAQETSAVAMPTPAQLARRVRLVLRVTGRAAAWQATLEDLPLRALAHRPV